MKVFCSLKDFRNEKAINWSTVSPHKKELTFDPNNCGHIHATKTAVYFCGCILKDSDCYCTKGKKTNEQL